MIALDRYLLIFILWILDIDYFNVLALQDEHVSTVDSTDVSSSKKAWLPHAKINDKRKITFTPIKTKNEDKLL